MRRLLVLALVCCLLALMAPGAGAATPGGAGADPDRDGLSTDFEQTRSLTDAARADTDQDGIRDGAEDPDGDGMGNAGEARYGTDPQLADTDGDGTDDWHGDFDLDGIPDGLEQDRRPIPARLVPSLANAEMDRSPSYFDGCHIGLGSVPRLCTYGARHARRTVVLFGDSHAAQWLPGLIEVGRRRGWRIVALTKSSCPGPLVTIARNGGPYTSCDTWRAAALRMIDRLRPALVVMTSLRSHDLWWKGHLVRRTDASRLWRRGFLATLRRLDRAARHVIVLGDTPRFRAAGLGCLRAHRDDVSRCSVRRANALSTRRDSLERNAAATLGIPFRATGPLVCPYDPCPVIVDRHLIVRDQGHLTATYSRILSRGLERLITLADP